MKIPSKLPGRLGVRGGPPVYTGGTAAFNYSIDEMPWLSAASNADYGNRRIKRETAPFRKQQFDAQTTPGEQSLDGYWIRSQQSFHGGAGLLFNDPSDDSPKANIRFYTSKGVNVWTPGEVTLLKKSNSQNEANVIDLCSFITADGVGAVAYIQASTIGYVRTSGSAVEAAWTDGTPLSMVSNGTNIFVLSTTGLWRAAIPNAGTALTGWTKIYTTTPTAGVLGWVKDRLIYGTGQNLYELSSNPGAPPAALPTAIYIAPSTSWQWTAITETTAAFYAVGRANDTSSILKFTLTTSSGTPVLSAGSVAASLPGGEVVYSAFGYLGSFLAIGTNRGVRVAVADTNGNLTYGPLLFETTEPVRDFCGYDRFLFCAYTGTDADIKLARVDLSTEISTLRFAWATDLIFPAAFTASPDATATQRVATFGGSPRLVYCTTQNMYVESATDTVYEGWIRTSRVRFSTLEPKNFRSLRVRGSVPSDGNPQRISVSTVSVDGVVTPVTSFGEGSAPGESDVVINPVGPQDYLSLLITLASDLATGTPVLNGWQMKALPGSPRQRLVTLPLWCFDFEKDRHGMRIGHSGAAMERVLALEDREASGALVAFQDLDAGITAQAFIESLEFEQAVPPPMAEGWGGIMTVVLRLI